MSDSSSLGHNPYAALIERRLSIERLRPYRVEVGGDLQRAVALYEWNATTSAAFFEVLGHFEVILRNSLHEQLTIWHAATGRLGQWYDDPAQLFDQRGRSDILKAREALASSGDVEVPGKVVAELSFGFWRFLLDKRYQATIWAPCLQKAFPHLQPRRRVDVSNPVADMNRLRNRIAHHEPIHGVPLGERHEALLQVAGYIDPGIRAWLSSLSQVRALLASRPL